MTGDSKNDYDEHAQLGEISSAGFFMHIAKTAGSYMNMIFLQAIGDRFVQHCEAHGRLDTNTDISLWSGHVYLENWRRIEEKRGWKMKRFTLLREPLSQLASHILWLDHYAETAYLREYRALDVETQKVVDEIAATELSDAGDVDRLLINLSGQGISYLDNCQSRYFLAGGNGVSKTMPLHLGMRPILQDAIDNFCVVGTSEKIKAFIASVSKEIGINLTYQDTRINEAKSTRNIILSDPEICTVLSKRITLDNWLYETVQRRWNEEET